MADNKLQDERNAEIYLSQEELKNALVELSKRTDIDEEIIHVLADGLLCDALCDLGYHEAIEVYEQIPKWYS